MDHAIDTNYLRTPELEIALQGSAPDDRFIVADTLLLETMKNAQWESTARASFRIITGHHQKIWVARAPGALYRTEIATGQDTADVIDDELSANFRLVLPELQSGTDGPGMAFARAQMPAAQASLARDQQNHVENRKGLQVVHDDVKKMINLKAYAALSDHDKEGHRLFLIKTMSKVALTNLLKLEGASNEIVQALVNGQGCLHRLQIGLYCLGFKWVVKGLNTYPEEKATNEIMDVDHAVIGTYCDDILTKEASVSQMRADILAVLNSPDQLNQNAAATP